MIWTVIGYDLEIPMVPGYPPDNLGRHWVGLAFKDKAHHEHWDSCWHGSREWSCKRKAKREMNKTRKIHQRGRRDERTS